MNPVYIPIETNPEYDTKQNTIYSFKYILFLKTPIFDNNNKRLSAVRIIIERVSEKANNVTCFSRSRHTGNGNITH